MSFLRRADQVNNIVTCFKMQLTNGKLLRFTDADQEILFEDELYICGSCFTPNAIVSSSELAQDNFMISGAIDEHHIKREALLAGDFADGYLEVFLLNLADMKKHILKTGWFGEIKCGNRSFTAEICSLASKTNNVIGKCYSASCRAEFGDRFCKVSLDKYMVHGEVTDLAEENSFIDDLRQEPDDYFNYGSLTFISGTNKGRKYNILEFRDKRVVLDFVLDLKIDIGDKYSMVVGCNKAIDTCIEKFNNAINFRGEPYIPSRHQLVIGNE